MKYFDDPNDCYIKDQNGKEEYTVHHLVKELK